MNHRPLTTSHIIEYAALRALEIMIRLLPRTPALALGGFIGGIVGRFGPRIDVVRKNMAHTGYWSPEETELIIKRLYRNMGRYAVDFLYYSRTSPPHDFTDIAIFNRLSARGKGIIAIVAHFGNWEALAAIFGTALPLHVVAMPMRNRLVQKWLQKRRDNTGVITIQRTGALRRMLQALKTNNIVAILIDQYPGEHGTAAPFLGKNAKTVRTVAGLIDKTGCPVIGSYALLKEDNTYSIMFSEGRTLDVSRDDHEGFITAYQREHNDMISSWIRNHPDHYFGWFHHRFRGTIDYSKQRAATQDSP